MNIKGKIVTLRAMTYSDREFIVELFNDPEVENFVTGWAFPLSLEQHDRWFEKHLNDQNEYRFVIETELDGIVGIVALTSLDWKNRSAESGIKIRSGECRQRGFGTDALMALQRFVFDELGLHRLNADWLVYNIASEKLHYKCGFIKEGRYRDYIFKHGVWHDLICAGILESDYRKLLEKNHYWDI